MLAHSAMQISNTIINYVEDPIEPASTPRFRNSLEINDFGRQWEIALFGGHIVQEDGGKLMLHSSTKVGGIIYYSKQEIDLVHFHGLLKYPNYRFNLYPKLIGKVITILPDEVVILNPEPKGIQSTRESFIGIIIRNTTTDTINEDTTEEEEDEDDDEFEQRYSQSYPNFPFSPLTRS